MTNWNSKKKNYESLYNLTTRKGRLMYLHQMIKEDLWKHLHQITKWNYGGNYNKWQIGILETTTTNDKLEFWK